jgi:hypothetical protein
MSGLDLTHTWFVWLTLQGSKKGSKKVYKKKVRPSIHIRHILYWLDMGRVKSTHFSVLVTDAMGRGFDTTWLLWWFGLDTFLPLSSYVSAFCWHNVFFVCLKFWNAGPRLGLWLGLWQGPQGQEGLQEEGRSTNQPINQSINVYIYKFVYCTSSLWRSWSLYL